MLHPDVTMQCCWRYHLSIGNNSICWSFKEILMHCWFVCCLLNRLVINWNRESRCDASIVLHVIGVLFERIISYEIWIISYYEICFKSTLLNAIFPWQDLYCFLCRMPCFLALSIIRWLKILLRHMFKSPSMSTMQCMQSICGTPGSLGTRNCITFSHWQREMPHWKQKLAINAMQPSKTGSPKSVW